MTDKAAPRPGRDIWQTVEAQSLPDEAEVMARWPEGAAPLVTVYCSTFRHVDFIEDALCGILLQRTDFPFEILVHDDASEDGTVDKIRAMAARYPAIIRPILQTENQYSQDKRPWMFMEPKARGDFIAMCEGDDFWCDPHKLQKQADVLRANPDVSVTSHDSLKLFPDGTVSARGLIAEAGKDRDFSANELQRGAAGLSNLSICFRRITEPPADERGRVLNGDTFLYSMLGCLGRHHYLGDIIPGRYRVHEGGVWSQLSRAQRRRAHRTTFFWLAAYHGRMGRTELCAHFQARFTQESWYLGEVGSPALRAAIRWREHIKDALRPLLRR